MDVVNVRDALIAWYLRRGDHKTGETEPFPCGDDRFGAPLRDDLSFLGQEKEALIQSHFRGKNAKSASAGCRLRRYVAGATLCRIVQLGPNARASRACLEP